MKIKITHTEPVTLFGKKYQPGEELDHEEGPQLDNLLADGRVESAEPKEEEPAPEATQENPEQQENQ